MSKDEYIQLYEALECESTSNLQLVRAMINNIFKKRGLPIVEQMLVDIEFDDCNDCDG